MKRILLLLFGLLTFSQTASAHAFGYDLNGLSGVETNWVYFKIGFQHILPYGFDHILFVLGLFFLNPNFKSVFAQTGLFTIAHCLTLGLSMSGYINPNTSVIEPVIALSILFVAIENIFTTKLQWWRLIIVFAFGLIHGCGFASALTDVGLPEDRYFSSLLMFNLGVEAGQIAVIMIAYIFVVKWFKERIWYHERIVIPVSGLIGCVALYWTIERTFFQ